MCILFSCALACESIASAAPKTQRKTQVISLASEQDVGSYAGKVVAAIDISGLKRIEKDAVLAKVGSKVGSPITADQIRADVQALFAMGYFDDISVEADNSAAGVKLIFVVRERPVISKVDFEGNERLSTSDLQDVIKVKEWSILDVNKVKEDAALIQKHYEDKGFYLAKVSYEVKQDKPDQVHLTYRINDYDKIQIKNIAFLNNKRFSDEQLRGVFQETREGGFFSFLSSSGNFKESSFKTDLQRLSLWYLDHGYVKFRYENPVVTVSDDKKWLYISIYLDEGEQYSMGSFDFSGDLLFPKDELFNDLQLKTGETFSLSRRNADIQKLTEKYQDLGYAFVNVIPKTNVHDDSKTVDIDYGFEKGSLVYFGEINVLGNTKTLDKVIRRELKIHEGELYSGTKLRQSRENVERLGYFSPGEVVFNTVTPKGKPDILNVDINVKERSTGTITLGAGYGSVQGFFLTSTISEINLFGRGQTLSFGAQYSNDDIQKSFNLGFTDPYAFDTLWTAGSDFYYVAAIIPSLYTTRKLGGDIKGGHPLAEYVYGYITYKNEGLQIFNPQVLGIDDLIALDSGVLSSVVFSAVRDKRNNRFETTDGNYQSASLETAGIGGDKYFYKWTLNNRFYKKIIGDLVFRTSAEVGDISPFGNRALPPSEKFFLGGPNNLKGYNAFSVSPSRPGFSAVDGSPVTVPLGGSFESFSLFEFEYPLLREAGLKWVLFYDLGNSWDSVPSWDYLVVRQDAGFGIRWFSPIGPLRFEWGFPLTQPNTGMVFSFFIGPPF